MDTKKALNLANMLLGIGILLLIVPVGYIILTLVTSGGEESGGGSLVSLGWISFIVLSLLPAGLGAFIAGLTWMSVIKRKMKKEDIDADDEKDTAEEPSE
ncbi:MAG: hypothetical protein AAF571_06715 [Verrucomicrobiota bacterium]